MPKLFTTCLAAGLLLLTSCSGADVLNSTITREGYHVVKDVTYGAQPRQKMDVYIPDHVEKPAPVIIFFYGGSWQNGSKNDYRFLGQSLTSKGFIVAVPDYRHYPEAYFPEFVEDGAKAFAYIHEHCAQYGADPKKLFLAGHSAGAHIAMLLTLDTAYMRRAHANPKWIRGTLGIAGPYDFLPLTDEKLVALFSKVPLRTTQPINYVRDHTPPVFLAHGTADEDVSISNSKNLAQKLQRYNDKVETHYYQDVGHIGIILSMAEGFRSKSPLLEDMAQFVKNTAQ